MARLRGCLTLWREENDELAGRWREATRAGPGSGDVAKGCQLAFNKLLQKMQGLPAALPALPVELTVLYNSLLLDLGLSGDSGEKLWTKIDTGLHRVLEACAVPGQGLSSEAGWRRVLQQRLPEELQSPLHRLAALQGVLWLASGRWGVTEGLFQLLSGAKNPGKSPCHGCKNEFLSRLQAWHPPRVGDSDLHVVQSATDLKDVLCTSAAFLQGCRELESGDFPAALASFQAAATGLCSKRVLAQIFTLMGICMLKMGKAQTAIQHLKQALQTDFKFFPALFQAALLYRQLGLTGAELEALALLDQALDGPAQEAAAESVRPLCLIHPELLVCSPQVTAFFGQSSPSEVKYLLAQRCLQAGRTSDAVGHYLDLLALFQKGTPHQAFVCGELPLPRIPEVFLEAASALQQVARHQDAMTVCEEVVTRTSELVPNKRLHIDLGSLRASRDILEAVGHSLMPPPSGSSLLQRKMESLRCVLWRAAASLLWGQACARLGKAKEAISHLSRCLDDLLKVHFVNTGAEENAKQVALADAELLPQMRLLALTARGVQFLELGQDKEALMDFQHAWHVYPDSPSANWHLLHTLWKLDRRQEATAHWQKVRLSPALMEDEAERAFPLYLLSSVKQLKFLHTESLMKKLENDLHASSRES